MEFLQGLYIASVLTTYGHGNKGIYEKSQFFTCCCLHSGASSKAENLCKMVRREIVYYEGSDWQNLLEARVSIFADRDINVHLCFSLSMETFFLSLLCSYYMICFLLYWCLTFQAFGHNLPIKGINTLFQSWELGNCSGNHTSMAWHAVATEHGVKPKWVCLPKNSKEIWGIQAHSTRKPYLI